VVGFRDSTVSEMSPFPSHVEPIVHTKRKNGITAMSNINVMLTMQTV
jgi:hypothetical protein